MNILKTITTKLKTKPDLENSEKTESFILYLGVINLFFIDEKYFWFCLYLQN